MTTVAFRDGVMACDSKVSGDFLSKIQDKVVKGRGVLVGYCGDLIAAWSGAMYLAGEVQDRPITTREDDVMFLIYRDGELYLADAEFREVPLKPMKYYAIGSGGQAAMVAMHMGATAGEAIKMAIRVDDGSGGPVKEYRLNE